MTTIYLVPYLKICVANDVEIDFETPLIVDLTNICKKRARTIQ